MRRAAMVLAGGTFLLCGSGLAEEWQSFGARSRGMGGAGVGLQSAPSRMNPATAGINRTSLFPRIAAGVQATVHGNLLAELDDVADKLDAIDLNAIQTRLNAGTATAADLRSALQVVDELHDLEKERGRGVSFQGAALLDLGVPGLPIDICAGASAFGGVELNLDLGLQSAAALTDGGVSELLNTIGTGNTPATAGGTALATSLAGISGVTAAQANEIAFQAEQAGLDLSDPGIRDSLTDIVVATQANSGGSSDNTFKNNDSGATIQGIVLKEAGVSGALPLGDTLRLGLTLKLLEGTTYFRRIEASGLQDGNGLVEEIDDRDTFTTGDKTSTEFDVDVGLVAKIVGPLSVGVVGKYLTEPDFDFAGPGGKYELDRQVRGGAALTFFGERLSIAADTDLLTNTSDALAGFRSRQTAAGVEFAPFRNRVLALALRGGARRDLEAPEADTVYAAGVGLNILGFNIAASADVAASRTEIERAAAANGSQEEEIPNSAGVTAEVSWGRGF